MAIVSLLERYRDYLMSLPHVQGVGSGKKRVNNLWIDKEALLVFVDQKLPESELRPQEIVPASLEGTITDVIPTGKIFFFRLARRRPVQPGLSIGHYRVTAGTLGAIVYDEHQAPYLLSNNHVFVGEPEESEGSSTIGDPILQPGPYDGGTLNTDLVARLKSFIPLQLSLVEPDCKLASGIQKLGNLAFKLILPSYRFVLQKRNNRENLVDAALAEPISREIFREELLDVGLVRGTREAEAGMEVKKSGRTSGLTSGIIRAVNVTIQVQVRPGATAIFTHQILSDLRSEQGDSGSLVLDGDNMAVGLLFAGSADFALMNRIELVLKLLGANFNC